MGLPSSFETVRTMLDEFGLLGVGAVREVEAGDVEAGADELAEDLGVLQAGPRVATILARRARSRRRGEATIRMA